MLAQAPSAFLASFLCKSCSRPLFSSLSIQHPVYDCFYLALARRSAPLVTADKRLAAAAQALPECRGPASGRLMGAHLRELLELPARRDA